MFVDQNILMNISYREVAKLNISEMLIALIVTKQRTHSNAASHNLSLYLGMERHYGQYSMCRARSMSVVYSRCGSLIIDVDHRCRPSIVDVDRQSSMSKIDVDVDHRCWLSKINIDVDHRCRSSIVDADRRSSMSKIDVDVDHPSLLSKININVDHRCDR